MTPAGPAIAVVGSLNLDLVVRVPRLPGPGETVSGDDVFRNPGGKGANQAVAAARLGRGVAMVGCVGDDEAGRELLASLEADGVDRSRVRVVDGVPSGTAFITVGEDGENQIVVSPGANARVTPDDVAAAGPVLAAAAVTLLQLEVPLEAVAAAARSARGTVVLNPAPVRALPADLLSEVDVLVPNRVELAQLAAGPAPTTVEAAAELAGRLPAGPWWSRWAPTVPSWWSTAAPGASPPCPSGRSTPPPPATPSAVGWPTRSPSAPPWWTRRVGRSGSPRRPASARARRRPSPPPPTSGPCPNRPARDVAPGCRRSPWSAPAPATAC